MTSGDQRPVQPAHRLRNGSAAALLTLAACGGAVAYKSVSNTPHSLEAAPTTDCIEPAAAAMTAVDTLLAQPESSALYSGSFNISSPAAPGQLSSQQAFLQETAKADGVTIYNASDQLSTIIGPLDNSDPKKTPFGAYLYDVNSYMRQLGVTVSLGKPHVHYPDDGHVPTKAELQSFTARDDMRAILDAYNDMPRQYVAFSGLKHIILLSGLQETGLGPDTVGGEAVIDGPHNTYYLNVDAPLQPHDVDHELYHLVDSAECGPDAMFQDRQFRALNKGINIYSGKGIKPDTRFPSLTDTYEPEVTAETGLTQGTLAYSSAQAALASLGPTVMSYSDYHPNPAEDKAEIGAEIPDVSNYNEMADPSLPVINRKFRFLLGRLYTAAPGVAKFFIQTANRPQPAGTQQESTPEENRPVGVRHVLTPGPGPSQHPSSPVSVNS